VTLRGWLVDPGPLRRNRDYRLIWGGQLINNLGRQVTVVALPYQLYVLTGSPLSIGALAIVQLVPLIAFSMAGGAMADVMDRRRLLLATQFALGGMSTLLAILALIPSPPIVLIYVVAFFAAAVGAVDQPARTSATPRLVPREDLPGAIALNHLGGELSSVLGPALGGLLIAAAGLAAAYALDVLTFGAAIVALLMMRPMPPAANAARAGLRSIVEGLSFARRRPVILGTFVVDLDAMIFGMPAALFPILALDVFHAGPEGLGLLNAAPAVGAVLGSILSGRVSSVRFQGRAVLASVFVWGAAITAFGLVTFSLPLALVCLAVAGGADVFSAVFRGTILQLAVPDHLRGRLSALHLTVVVGGPRIGGMESTAVAAITNAPFSVVSGGLLCLAGLALVAWRFPQLARYDAHAPTDEDAADGNAATELPLDAPSARNERAVASADEGG
jgi:MFS family permease